MPGSRAAQQPGQAFRPPGVARRSAWIKYGMPHAILAAPHFSLTGVFRQGLFSPEVVKLPRPSCKAPSH